MSGAHDDEFPLPRWFRAKVSVDQGRFALVEDGGSASGRAALAEASMPDDGIVTAVDGGLVVLTHHQRGEMDVRIQVRGEPADDAALGTYDDVVEISYHARSGFADLVTPGSAQPAARGVTFPGPGPVRARVSKTVRNHENPGLSHEKYVIELWRAPEAPEQVLRNAADVAAARATGPERAYDWVEQSALRDGGCLTFCPGADAEEVLDAFHADPADSVAWSDRHDTFPDLTPFIGLIPVAGGVVAVEDNGWTGSEPWVLQAVSSPGRRAASAFWNVNALRSLGFARHGVVLASAEWGLEALPPDLDPEITDAVAGIDYHDVHALTAKDILAATRFTDLTLGPEDLDALEATGRAYPIRQDAGNS